MWCIVLRETRVFFPLKMSANFDENKLIAKQSDFKSCFARSMAINNSKCVRTTPILKTEIIQENLDFKQSVPLANEIRLRKVSKKDFLCIAIKNYFIFF